MLLICVGSESVAVMVTGLLSCHKEAVRFFDWHVLLSPLSFSPFTCGFNCEGNPLRLDLSMPQYIPVQVEVYTTKVVVKVKVSRSSVRPRPVLVVYPCFPTWVFCSGPHVDALSYLFERHVYCFKEDLLLSWPRLYWCPYLARTQQLPDRTENYWPNLSQRIILWTLRWW